MTTYQHILIILDTFEIIFIGALFGPGTAVTYGQIDLLKASAHRADALKMSRRA